MIDIIYWICFFLAYWFIAAFNYVITVPFINNLRGKELDEAEANILGCWVWPIGLLCLIGWGVFTPMAYLLKYLKLKYLEFLKN